MYEFAIVVLLGIGTFKLIDMLNEFVDLTKVQSVLTMALAAVVSWALGFSIFEHWNVAVRSEALGYVGTGLIMAAAGYVTPKVLEHVAEVIGQRRDTHVRAA